MVRTQSPDQAYCWVIALAACVINTILSGITRAAGIIYVALIDAYQITRFEANMPFTLRICCRNLSGPVVGILGQRYGVRVITLIGCIFAVAGIGLCCIAPNIIWISIFWGVFHGSGVALGNTLYHVAINKHFVKYRATATGLALSGGCIGSFVFPVMLETFLSQYGLHGTFLLTSGVAMHAIPASMLLIEPPLIKQYKAYDRSSRKLRTTENAEERTYLQNCKEIQTQELSENKNTVCQLYVSVNRPTDLKLDEIHCPKNNLNSENYQNEMEKLEKSDNTEILETVIRSSTPQEQCKELDNFDEAEVHNLSEQITVTEAVVRVCKNPMFYIISVSLAVFGTLFDPLVTVIVDYMTDKGLDRDVGKYFITVLAVGDLIGRLCFGLLIDKQIISIAKSMMLIQITQGVCFALLPFFSSFAVLIILTIVYGISSGINIIIIPILVATYIPLEQAIAMGSITFLAGIFSFSVPPLIGYFRDNEGSYDGMFYIFGIISTLTGLIWLLEPWIMKNTNDRTAITKNEV